MSYPYYQPTNHHRYKISIKVARVIGIMNKLNHIFPRQILRTLYNSLIHPHFIYQLSKLHHKNTNNLLPSYFSGFTPYYNNAEPTHDPRSATLRLPMTRREYFVQSTKYQFLKLIRETLIIDLNRTINYTVFQFAAYFKYAIINRYDSTCRIVNCYVCG